jgi:endonuclease YncB( thermonuclease family)
MSDTGLQKWDEQTAASSLKKRRYWRIAGIVLVAALVASIAADHLRPQNRHGDDWLRFDGHRVPFVKAVDGQSIAITDDPADEVTVVSLRGIKSAGPSWDQKSAEALDALLAGKGITLHLKPTTPRDEQGRLLADVFLDRDLLSARLVEEGLVLTDRTGDSDFISEIRQAQAKAKRRRAGLWAE